MQVSLTMQSSGYLRHNPLLSLFFASFASFADKCSWQRCPTTKPFCYLPHFD